MSDLVQLARDVAETWDLDGSLVCAMVEQESEWNPWLSRYEPQFFAKYLDKASVHLQVREFCKAAPYTVSFDTELYERAVSRGPLQVLGQVARERGFKDPLAKLHDPETGLSVGCSHLRYLLDKVGRNLRLALLRYNGGSDTAYPDKVLGRMRKYVS